jgi:hypothetical protein
VLIQVAIFPNVQNLAGLGSCASKFASAQAAHTVHKDADCSTRDVQNLAGLAAALRSSLVLRLGM